MMLESKELLDVSEIEKLVIIKNGSNYYIASNVVDKVERVWQDIISKAPEIAEDERYLDKWFGVFEQSNGEIGYIPP